jgi:NAD(P)-dependent dehydrogenase (short-subunit alcohol dehydrogenase family)
MSESVQSLDNRTLLITGDSRGIGKVIALRAGHDRANIVVAAKTDRRHPKLPATIKKTRDVCTPRVLIFLQRRTSTYSAIRQSGGSRQSQCSA